MHCACVLLERAFDCLMDVLSYDSWFDYVRLEESVGNKDRVRQIYERGYIVNVPPSQSGLTL